MKRSMYLGAILLTVLVVFVGLVAVRRAGAANSNGAGGQMPAYFDGQLFTINLKEMPSEGILLLHNKSVNIIYMCACAPAGQPFVSVLNEIQGRGFNPLWNEVDIVFNAGQTPVQFTSDDAILAAAASGVITLAPTPDVYRCAVVGPGPK